MTTSLSLLFLKLFSWLNYKLSNLSLSQIVQVGLLFLSLSVHCLWNLFPQWKTKSVSIEDNSNFSLQESHFWRGNTFPLFDEKNFQNFLEYDFLILI